MADTTWKPAKKAYTKAQKRRRSEIREEFEWTLEIPKKRPELMVFGQWKWIESLINLNEQYKEASDGRDELINKHMLLFATFRPELFEKVSNGQELTDKDRKDAERLLKSAVADSPKE